MGRCSISVHLKLAFEILGIAGGKKEWAKMALSGSLVEPNILKTKTQKRTSETDLRINMPVL